MIRKVSQMILVLFTFLMLAFPLCYVLFPAKWFDRFAIHEAINSSVKPSSLREGIFKRDWQRYYEQQLLQKLAGLRAFLILSYNEAVHTLFTLNAQKTYLRTSELGYYPVDTIKRLNDDVLHHNEIKLHYEQAAQRLYVLQQILSHYDVTLLVVSAPPKVRIYPEYVSRYLVASANEILDHSISYADILQEHKVHVFNVQRFFNENKAKVSWPFFTDTSFHWSFWGACLATKQILLQAGVLSKNTFFPLECSRISYEKSKWQDKDIAGILNLFSKEAIVKNAPFPEISPAITNKNEKYAIAIIGDSFSDQIIHALTHAFPEENWRPNWLTFYSYFKNQRIVALDGMHREMPLNKETILSELLKKKLLILEISDGNIFRDASNLDNMEFGATKFLLEKLLPNRDQGVIALKNFLVDGWSENKVSWMTVSNHASFVMHTPKNNNSIPLELDIENRYAFTQKIRVLLKDKVISEFSLRPGRQKILLSLAPKETDTLLFKVTLLNQKQPLNIALYSARVADKQQQPIEYPQIKTVSLEDINVFNELQAHFDVGGLSSVESNGKDTWRWGLGPKTRLLFYVDPSLPAKMRQMLLRFSFTNPLFAHQTVTMKFNGKIIRVFAADNSQQQVDSQFYLTAKKGLNTIEWIYSNWREPHEADSRQLAIAFQHLTLQAQQHVRTSANVI